jgi:hypothetical protein
MAEEEVPQALASLAYAAAKLRAEGAAPLLQRLLPAAQPRMRGFRADEVCQLLWAVAHVGLPAGQAPPLALLEAAAARLARDAGACDARLLCLAVHALGVLKYRGAPALLEACVHHVAAAGEGEVPVSLLAKLLWGCAHVGYEPEEELLEAITADLYHRLSHSRGNSTVGGQQRV